jgi:hypothetical protein
MNTQDVTNPEHITAAVARTASDREASGDNSPDAVPSDHAPLVEDTPATYYDTVVRLPGFREPPNRCRPFTPVGFCEAGHTVLGRSSCGTRYCPDHWRDWCEDAVVAMVARLAAYRYAVDGAEKRLSHVVASPPQDRRYSAREMWETRSEAYEALEAAGVDGGVTVTHPYRTNDRGDALYETARDAGELEDDTGRWKFLRELADGWEELAQYVEASPHYHALAAGADIDGSRAPAGWVVERIRTVKPFHHIRDTTAYESMVAPAYYVLTHAADQEGRQTVTYFGDVHPASFDPEEALTTATWERIQMEAEKAVKEYDVEEEIEAEGSGHGTGRECPCEDCGAAVIDVMHLPEYMEKEDWVAEVRRGRDGRERYNRLLGVLLWWEGRCDTPPPSAVSTEHKFREWLAERGSVHTPDPRQVSIEAAVMG